MGRFNIEDFSLEAKLSEEAAVARRCSNGDERNWTLRIVNVDRDLVD